MMKRLYFGFVSAASLSFAGCSLHPLVENFEGARTIEIVDRIRCEAKIAIMDETIRLLRTSVERPEERERSIELAEKLSTQRDLFEPKKLIRLLTTPGQKYFYNRYINTAIAYSFSFDITEINQNNTETDLLKAVTAGTVGLNIKASDQRTRESRRTFLVSETFGHLLDDKITCEAPPYDISRISKSTSENDIYPVTGVIGLGETIKTFIEINREGILEKRTDDKAPTMADKLLFTTQFTGSINPIVTLAPITRNLHVNMASLNSQATRTDLNEVDIGLSLFPKDEALVSTVRNTIGNRTTVAQAVPFAINVNNFGTAVFSRKDIFISEQRAINAISQNKIDSFYSNFDRAFLRSN